MAKIIFKCPHLKPGKTSTHRANLVRYIAMREGVVIPQARLEDKPCSTRQRGFIAELLSELPDTAEFYEYHDFLEQPNMANASRFITMATEYGCISTAGRGRYVSYMATRPGVSIQGSHGLFTSPDEPLALSRVMDVVAQHPGNVWIPIISLRREDADRLGYNNPKNWQALLEAQAHTMAIAMQIDPAHFKWYAAFHDEGHHPHIHMVCYSTDAQQGFLTVQGIRKIKSELAKSIFRHDLLHIYKEQTQHRDETAEFFRQLLAKQIAAIQDGTLHNPQITASMLQLVDKLKHHTGRKVYGYLRPPVKQLVDCIVDELAQDSRVAEAYALWLADAQQIAATYSSNPLPALPLSTQKEFKHIRNMVVNEAAALLEGGFQMEEPAGAFEEIQSVDRVTPVPADIDIPEHLVDEPEPPAATHYVGWTKEYKAARLRLYGNKEVAPDLPKALPLMTAEAEKGNALAMYDLGRMYADGLGCETDADTSFHWYEQSLLAFLRCEQAEENKYYEYRIGKMYLAGLGCEVDEEYAAQWLQKSARQGYKYAEYSLGCMHRDGKGVDKDIEAAFGLFSKAAAQSFPYASFELGKMCRDGSGAPKNEEAAQLHFEDAYIGFEAMAKELADDRLLYRLGWMQLTGTGTEQDESLAEETFIKAAKLGNLHAKYQLAKMYIKRPNTDPTVFMQAVEWMTEAARDGSSPAQYSLGKLYIEATQIYNPQAAAYWLGIAATEGNKFAQYRLGKLLLDGQHLPVDIPQGRKWLEASAAQENQFAMHLLGKSFIDERFPPPDHATARHWFEQAATLGNESSMYQLGKSYLQGEPKDTIQAVQWLEQAAELENQYAQYALGKLYLFGTEVERDEAAAKRWSALSAAQGNIYAQYILQHMAEWSQGQAMMAGTRLLMGIGKLFENKVTPAAAWHGHRMDHKRQQELRRRGKAKGGGLAMLDEGIEQTPTR